MKNEIISSSNANQLHRKPKLTPYPLLESRDVCILTPLGGEPVIHIDGSIYDKSSDPTWHSLGVVANGVARRMSFAPRESFWPIKLSLVLISVPVDNAVAVSNETEVFLCGPPWPIVIAFGRKACWFFSKVPKIAHVRNFSFSAVKSESRTKGRQADTRKIRGLQRDALAEFCRLWMFR